MYVNKGADYREMCVLRVIRCALSGYYMPYREMCVMRVNRCALVG